MHLKWNNYGCDFDRLRFLGNGDRLAERRSLLRLRGISWPEWRVWRRRGSVSSWPATARRHITLTDSLRRITGLQTETRGAICRSHRPAGAAGAGYRGGHFSGATASGTDVEGANGAVSRGVGTATATLYRRSLTALRGPVSHW